MAAVGRGASSSVESGVWPSTYITSSSPSSSRTCAATAALRMLLLSCDCAANMSSFPFNANRGCRALTRSEMTLLSEPSCLMVSGCETRKPPWETNVHWTQTIKDPALPGRRWRRSANFERRVAASFESRRSMVERMMLRSVVWRQDSSRLISFVRRACVMTVPRDIESGAVIA